MSKEHSEYDIRGKIVMSTFNRYCIHFSIFGFIFLIGAIVLIVADGGELLNPIFLISIIFADAGFVFLMSLLYCSFAKPVKLNLKVDNKTEFLEQLNEVSEKNGEESRLKKLVIRYAISLEANTKIGL